MTELQGLQGFKYDGAAAIWAAWTDCPHLSLALDQGAGGVSASWWMMAQDLTSRSIGMRATAR